MCSRSLVRPCPDATECPGPAIPHRDGHRCITVQITCCPQGGSLLLAVIHRAPHPVDERRSGRPREPMDGGSRPGPRRPAPTHHPHPATRHPTHLRHPPAPPAVRHPRSATRDPLPVVRRPPLAACQRDLTSAVQGPGSGIRGPGPVACRSRFVIRKLASVVRQPVRRSRSAVRDRPHPRPWRPSLAIGVWVSRLPSAIHGSCPHLGAESPASTARRSRSALRYPAFG